MTFKTKNGTELPLISLKGKDYLQVAHRVQWFREDKPNWSIETEIKQSSDIAVVKAVIKDESGRVIATAHKAATKVTQMGHPIEHAETGAIGRALALCGYGTQFAEIEEVDVVDAPLAKGGNSHRESAPPWVEEESKLNVGTENGINSYKFKVCSSRLKGKAIEDVGRDEMKEVLKFWASKKINSGSPLHDDLTAIKEYLS